MNRKKLSVAALVLSICFCLGYYFEKSSYSSFLKKSKAILKSVGSDIKNTDKWITLHLESSLKCISNELDSKRAMSKARLENLKEQFRTTLFSMFDKEGHLLVTTNESNAEDYKKLYGTHFSVIKCYTDMITSDNEIRSLPFFPDSTRSKANKVAIVWNKKNGVLITASHNDSDGNRPIYNILKENFDIHSDNILSITLATPKGAVISTINGGTTAMKSFNSFSNEFIIERNKKFITLTRGFEIDKNLDLCVQKLRNRTTDSGEYFYVLSADFNSNELDQDVMFIRVLFTIIGLLSIAVIYLSGSDNSSSEIASLLMGTNKNFMTEKTNDDEIPPMKKKIQTKAKSIDKKKVPKKKTKNASAKNKK